MPARAQRGVRSRADAVRNRGAILEAARRLYGQRGLNVPIDEIARLAGVGNATLYRHFPTRCALIAAVFAETLRHVVQVADAALCAADPWVGFARHVMFLTRLQAADRGLADLLTTEVIGAPELEDLRLTAYEKFVRIADRAKRNGTLRSDFVPEDIAVLLMANAGLVHRTADAAPTAWNRFTHLALDGLRTEAATPGPASPGREAVRRAMKQLGSDLGYNEEAPDRA
jgi:AcrR family transcriptional regulator